MTGQQEHNRDTFFSGTEASESLRIIGRLREAGFVAYLAGGCVRDALLGKRPKDYDVATNATPDSVRKVFGHASTLAFGASFGVIGVLPERKRTHQNRRGGAPLSADDNSVAQTGTAAQTDTAARTDTAAQAREPTEVATFRSDGTYSDGRRPDTVHFGVALQDALRRDFTINGLFYDPESRQIIDHVGGQADLRDGLLRTIGDAASRIDEDKLRMLRAVRFATTLGFTMHPDTVAAISAHSGDIDCVSGERIGAEMRRVLTSPNAVDGLKHLRSLGLHDIVLPELAGIDWDRYESIVAQISVSQVPVSLASLLVAIHPNGRTVDAIAHLNAIAQRWKLSNEERRQTRSALERWTILRDAASLRWSAVQPTLVDRDAVVVVEFAAVIVAADQSGADGVNLAREALAWPKNKLDPTPLLTGDDLRSRGFPAGPAYQTILQSIRNAQLDGEITSREQAIASLPPASSVR